MSRRHSLARSQQMDLTCSLLISQRKRSRLNPSHKDLTTKIYHKHFKISQTAHGWRYGSDFGPDPKILVDSRIGNEMDPIGSRSLMEASLPWPSQKNPYVNWSHESVVPSRSGRSPRFPTVYDIGFNPIATRRRRRRDWGWEAAMARSRR